MSKLFDRNNQLPTLEEVREKYSYDPDTGHFTILSGKHEGKVPWRMGYISLNLNGCRLKATRVAHLLMTGDWPQGVMDHINGIVNDDRWANLRDVPHSDNLKNRFPRKATRRNQDKPKKFS